MSRASVRNRGSPASRVWQGSSAPGLGAGRPLEVVPPPEIDDVTGLPLVVCPNCGDLRLTAFTCRWTKNRGKRYFKCPRNNEWAVNKCGIIMVQDQYESYLQGDNAVLSGLMVDVAPSQLMEEIQQVKMEFREMKEELSMIKLGMDEMKKTEPRKTPWVVVLSVVFGFVLMCIVWFVLKTELE